MNSHFISDRARVDTLKHAHVTAILVPRFRSQHGLKNQLRTVFLQVKIRSEPVSVVNRLNFGNDEFDGRDLAIGYE